MLCLTFLKQKCCSAQTKHFLLTFIQPIHVDNFTTFYVNLLNNSTTCSKCFLQEITGRVVNFILKRII